MPARTGEAPHTENERPLALGARWIFPVTSPPMAEAWLTIAGGRITSLGQSPPPDAQRIDLGDAIILPGLINAHAHLEFSLLETPLGKPGQPLPDWIRQVLAYRRTSQVDRAEAIATGMAESERHGVAFVGEIATGDWQRSWYGGKSSGAAALATGGSLRLLLFHELIGFTSAAVAAKVDEAALRLDEGCQGATPDRLQNGLSPHAPYTMHPQLLQQLVALAGRRGCPLAMHLAESPEEIELLAHGTGPMRQLLEDAGVWEEGVIARGTTPSDYLQMLTAGGSQVLAVHGNYFSVEEIALAAALADRLAVVYCPRTHAYFGHSRYPLAEMLAAGVRVVLGTDGRSSNPDLNILEEVRYVAEHHSVSVERALGMVTLQAAQALGHSARFGSLEAGKNAVLTVLQLPGGADPANPLEWLLDRRTNAVDWCSKTRGGTP